MDRRTFLGVAAAAPLALRSPAALAGGRAVVLVTADTRASVVAVDAGSGRVLRRLATLDGPRSVERVGAAAVVAHTELGAVTIVDGRELRVGRVLRSFAAPRYTAAARDGRHAYVTDSERGELVTIDLAHARVTHRLELGGPARHLGLDPSGTTLWIALGNRAPALAVVGLAASPRLLRRVVPPFLAHDVGFAPDGRVWVTSGDRRAVAILDRGGRVLRTLGADAPPQHVAFARRVAHVTSGDDGTLRVHALDGTRLRTTRVPVGSYNVQAGGGRVVTPSLARGTLCVLDERGRLLREVAVAPSSHDAALVVSA